MQAGSLVGFMSATRHLEIVGAGPAGLAAALTARAAAAVTVYEKHARAGARFHGDFQGLENWSTEEDALAELARYGVAPQLEPVAAREVVCFDSRGEALRLSCADRPLFYLIERGTSDEALDTVLVRQALAAGAQVRWSTRMDHLPGSAIIAEGPHEADIIAVGYTFTTDMADGYFAVMAESLAPGGYAYLLVSRGAGTVATCLFRRFHDERLCLERTIEFFARHAGLRWREAHAFGGSGALYAQAPLRAGPRLYAGESAGLQDPLFGFGLRYALLSGHFAARAWIAESPLLYERLWRERLRGFVRAGAVNRRLYEWLGDGGRRLAMRLLAPGRDPRRVLQRIYRPSRVKSLLGALVASRGETRQRRPGCDCTWCRCHSGRQV